MRYLVACAALLAFAGCREPAHNPADLGLGSDLWAMCAEFDDSSAPIVSQSNVHGTSTTTDTGGTISDGTYFLTSSTVYDVPDANYPPVDSRQAMRFASGTVSIENKFYQDSYEVIASWSGTYTTSGATLSFTPTCGPATPYTVAYTANGKTLSITLDGATQPNVNVFTKQ